MLLAPNLVAVETEGYRFFTFWDTTIFWSCSTAMGPDFGRVPYATDLITGRVPVAIMDSFFSGNCKICY